MITDAYAAVANQQRLGRVVFATGSIDRALGVADLLERAERMWGALGSRGLEPGDAIVLRARQSVESAALLLAGLQGALTIIPMPAGSRARELASVARTFRAALVVDDSDGHDLPELGAPRSQPSATRT
jgi:acyl-CoA synthetase (AMP-forming)/AMP-acid ligase II